MKADFWNDRYASDEYIYGKEPNAFLAQQLSKLDPGNLLLPAEGEGRNAVFAARQGWQVHAIDQSEEGKKKCLKLANQFGVTIDYSVEDIQKADFQQEKYDVIALIYAHFPAKWRKAVHQNLVKALKPGGVLMLEAFNPQQMGNSSGGPKDKSMLYDVKMLEADFSELDVKLLEELTTDLEEGEYHYGKANVVRLVAIKK